MIVPPIKLQGIKTKLVTWISTHIPSFTGKWVEPFAGTCVVGFNMKPKQALFCDTNPFIINFYDELKENKITPAIIRDFLEYSGHELLVTNGEYYYTVRNRLNTNGSSLDFLFVNRSCFNGLMRFNSSGKFNVPFCKKPNRFSKAYITKIVNQCAVVYDLIHKNDWTFVCQGFEKTLQEVTENDFVYCDPPYINRHSTYYSDWSENNERNLYDILHKTNNFIISSWHSNRYRKNDLTLSVWREYNIVMRDHFYHIGASEENRGHIVEMLILGSNI